MKIMFIFLNDRKRTLIPTNLCLLKASVQNHGFQTKIFDTSFYEEHERFKEEEKKEETGIFKKIDYESIGIKTKKTSLIEDFLTDVQDWQPDLLAFSVYSSTYKLGCKMAAAVKQKYSNNIITIFGGIHVSIAPENVINEPAIDLICLGEGEETLVELCEKLSEKKGIKNIRSIWLKENGKIIKNPLMPPINVNELPLPNWEGFNIAHHYAPYRGKLLKTALVEFSRTCLFDCGYCGNRILKDIYKTSGVKSIIRHKSPAKFIKDLKFLKETYGVEFVSITDGTFLSFPTPLLEELAKIYIKEINLPFFIDSTVTTITPKRVELLKEMGCIAINMGIECGNVEYRQKYLLRNITDEQIIRAFKIVREAGIEARAYNIIGLPFETRKDIFKTIELNRNAHANSISLSIFVPYNGTYLRDLCIEKGFISKDHEVVGDGTIPNIKSDSISDDELIGLYNTFYLYVKVPKILFPIIRLLEKNNKFLIILRKLLLKIFG